jgi:hypothetical protein
MVFLPLIVLVFAAGTMHLVANIFYDEQVKLLAGDSLLI